MSNKEEILKILHTEQKKLEGEQWKYLTTLLNDWPNVSNDLINKRIGNMANYNSELKKAYDLSFNLEDTIKKEVHEKVEPVQKYFKKKRKKEKYPENIEVND